jgi:hypothetical protein
MVLQLERIAMRKLLTFFTALALTVGVAASSFGGSMSLLGVGSAPSVGYTGPGDVVSGAFAWYGLRAYSLAKAGTKVANVCNSGDANCADINSLANGKFDVTTAQGSPLNCGGAGGTCTIKTLYDQAAANNCGSATCDITQATISNRPVLTFSCLGSLPCMTFTGTSSQQLVTSNLATVSEPFTLSITDEKTVSGGASVFTAGNQFGILGNTNQYQAYAGNIISQAANDNVWHAANTAFVNGTTCNLQVDSVTSSGNCGSQGVSGNTFALGQAFSSFWTGSVAEIGIWASAFNSTQLNNMNSNQHTYWGF